jgi:hypothetical protein
MSTSTAMNNNIIPQQLDDKQLVNMIETFFNEEHIDTTTTDKEIVINYSTSLSTYPIVSNSFAPTSIMMVHKIQNIPFNRPLRVLFDSGSDSSHIQRKVLPKEIQTTKVN